MLRGLITLYDFVLEHPLTPDISPSHDTNVEPLHIALFLSGLAGGGAQRRMLLLADGFTARGHRVELVLPRQEGPYRSQVPAAVQLVVLDNSLARLPGIRNRRGLWVASSTGALARYLEQARPDVLLSTSNPANLAALWARRRAGVATPIVISVNVNLGAATGERQPAWGGLLRMLVCRWYPYADTVIANSAGVAQDLAEVTTLQRHQIKVIENPVPALQIRESARQPLTHPWFAAGQPPVVLSVGKLKRQKDFGTLLRAFARVRGQRRVRLVILGEGEERNALQRMIRDLGIAADVYLPGFVENPYAWMARADLFVLSSAWEGFSNVLCEALACGCPVVSTDCPSGSAEILMDGAYGPLIPVGDDRAMADAIIKVLQSPPDRRKQQQRADDFTVERAVVRYLDVLTGVCHRNNGDYLQHDAVTPGTSAFRNGA